MQDRLAAIIASESDALTKKPFWPRIMQRSQGRKKNLKQHSKFHVLRTPHFFSQIHWRQREGQALGYSHPSLGRKIYWHHPGRFIISLSHHHSLLPCKSKQISFQLLPPTCHFSSSVSAKRMLVQENLFANDTHYYGSRRVVCVY